MVIYDEPDSNGGNKRVEITEEEAIRRQKEAAKNKSFTYRNDNEALEDYITIHWAWKE